VLRVVDRSLRTVITETFAEAPSLVVHGTPTPVRSVPRWARGAGLRGPLFIRVTSYRVGSVDVSRHVAALDPAALEQPHRSALRTESGDLGSAIAELGLSKTGHRFGETGDAEPVDDALRSHFPADRAFRRNVWRRFQIGNDDRTVGVVLEALSIERWAFALRGGRGTGGRP
jgi:hypothetical protein